MGYWHEIGAMSFGQRFSPEAMVHALEAGPLWRRHGVALELLIRTGGEQHVSNGHFLVSAASADRGLGGDELGAVGRGLMSRDLHVDVRQPDPLRS